jgi:predicted PurR-regulated permease PerM
MVTASPQQQNLGAAGLGGRSLFRIVSFACIAGFILDMLAVAMPPNLGALEWRVGFLQQLGDRSIILLLGVVFLMLSSLDTRKLRKQLGMICLGLGLVFLLSSVVAVRDNVVLRKQTDTNITAQSSQLLEQIAKAKDNPPANLKATPQQLDQALQQVNSRAEGMKKNAGTQLMRTGVSSVGNLAIIGLALLGVGRYGMRPTR